MSQPVRLGRRAGTGRMLTGALLLVVATAGPVFADGSNTLGPPGIAIGSGSGTVAAGVGLAGGPGTIDVNVPGDVVQALLYWEGFHLTQPTGSVLDDLASIEVNGVGVLGTVIGGPVQLFLTQSWTTAFRADITSMVGSGANSLSITGMGFSRISNGAGVIVIFDDGSAGSLIDIRDGNDAAFLHSSPPQDTTVPQTFTFGAEDAARTAMLTLMVGSVRDGRDRPTVVETTVGGVVTRHVNVLDSHDGPEWDTVTLQVAVPAGATALTVQALSDDGAVPPSGSLPASLVWVVGAMSMPTTTLPGGATTTTVPGGATTTTVPGGATTTTVPGGATTTTTLTGDGPDDTTTTTVAGPEETTTTVAGPDDGDELPETGAGYLLSALAGGMGLLLLGSGLLTMVTSRRRQFLAQTVAEPDEPVAPPLSWPAIPKVRHDGDGRTRALMVGGVGFMLMGAGMVVAALLGKRNAG